MTMSNRHVYVGTPVYKVMTQLTTRQLLLRVARALLVYNSSMRSPTLPAAARPTEIPERPTTLAHRERSMTTTVTLSRLPRSTAARVSTVAAMRAALWRLAPRCRARRRHRFARLRVAATTWVKPYSAQIVQAARATSSAQGGRASQTEH